MVADGSITRGSPDSNSPNGIESEAFDKTLSRVGNDSSVKGVIVRIDSPGGEVTASDEIWRAMNELGQTETGGDLDVRRRGLGRILHGHVRRADRRLSGYHHGLDRGWVFGKPNLHGLYDKLGVSKDSVSRGRFALIESDYESLTEPERQKLRDGIDSDYRDFLAKVAAARKKPVSAIEPIAQGRVWLGDQAKANGLVDELGGIDRAVAMIKAKSGIPASAGVTFVQYPPRRTLIDLLTKSGADSEVEARGGSPRQTPRWTACLPKPASAPCGPPGATPVSGSGCAAEGFA